MLLLRGAATSIAAMAPSALRRSALPALLPLLLLAHSAPCLLALVRAGTYVPVAGPSSLNSSAAVGWPSTSTRTAAVQAAIVTPFGPNPADTVFRCALIDIGVSTGGQLRDPFGGYTFPMNTLLASALAALPYGSHMAVASTDLDGLLVRVMLELQAQVGFTLEWVVAKPPRSLLPPLTYSTDAFNAWAFQAANASCVLWPSPASPARRLYFRQTTPLITFGYSVVTTRAQYTLPTTVERVFLWTRPFSAGVWCLLMTACVTYAFCMPMFEGAESNDFGDKWHKPHKLMGHAMYLGAMGPSKPDTFEPTTGAGRAAAALNAFALLLIISTYTANLAAQFATVEPSVRDVNDLTSFSPRVPACSRVSSTLLTLLNASYPNAAAALSPNNTFGYAPAAARDAINAVLAGSCEGAIVPATEAAWIMGINDTQGDLCSLEVVGAPEGDESLPITFSKASMTDAQLEAINMAIEDLQRAGEFIEDLKARYFPVGPRAVCAAEDSQDAAAAAMLQPAQEVGVLDLAGAFLLQAIGLTLGLIIHSCKQAKRKLRAWRAGRDSKAGSADDAAGAEQEGRDGDDDGSEKKVTRHERLSEVAHAA